MIGLQEQDDSVLQLDPLRLLRLELMQSGHRNLLPRLALLRYEQTRQQQGGAQAKA
jgi:hypothetical protein